MIDRHVSQYTEHIYEAIKVNVSSGIFLSPDFLLTLSTVS